MDGANYEAGREEATDICCLSAVRRLAAVLDEDPASIREGDALRAGWHVVLFPPLTRQADLGPDGHPKAGDFMPKSDLPRRVHGGRRIWLHRPVQIGSPLRRISEVAAIEHKQGRSGPLMVVTTRQSIHAAGESLPSIVEEQDIIYRSASGGAGSTASAPPQARHATHRRRFLPTSSILFRYSAATFNAHRIHYDFPYATAVEGYAGLVVNGSLTALMLLRLREQLSEKPPIYYEMRNLSVLFGDRDVTLCAEPTENGWRLWAEDDDGRAAVEASVRER